MQALRLELPTIASNTATRIVSLVVCGESHEDAIDVTRARGIFEPKFGWVRTTSNPIEPWATYRLLHSTQQQRRKQKLLTVQQCLEWGTAKVESYSFDDEVHFSDSSSLALVWTPVTTNGKKGKGYLVECFASRDDGDSADSKVDASNEHLDDDSNTLSAIMAQSERKVFLWEDLDAEAHALNQQRREEESNLTTAEMDALIDRRKERLRNSNSNNNSDNTSIWTWDDWFTHVRREQDTTNDRNKGMDVHLVLEAPVAPSEVRLHRPTGNDCLDCSSPEADGMMIPHAPDYIRCLAPDEEQEEIDAFDPSSDGVGSFLDYMYRRFANTEPKHKDWLHSIDIRDIGCEAATNTDQTRQEWESKLHEDELETILAQRMKKRSFQESLQVSSSHEDKDSEYLRYAPSNTMNPEMAYLETLKQCGDLKAASSDDDDDDEQSMDSTIDEENAVPFPSFEAFFGQSTDTMYYSPHCNLAYSPFLAKCVGSLENWQTFFSELFFGGTVQAALDVLDLTGSNKAAIHVRSPILKSKNKVSGATEYRKRKDSDEYISNPYFPFLFHLVSASNTGTEDDDPSARRTWSSDLYHRVRNIGTALELSGTKQFAVTARDWILRKIQRQADDPKRSDDDECGGEWFEAYLRAVHRDIYDDIDRSDASLLLRQKQVRGESEDPYRKKYDIGSITIPSAKNGFAEITDRFAMESELDPSELVTPRIEVFAKIIIDIWMSNLVDFCILLKIAEIIAKSDSQHVVVVCYLGSAHAKVMTDFFTSELGFRKGAFVGKVEWDEGEPRTLKLPQSLLDLP